MHRYQNVGYIDSIGREYQRARKELYRKMIVRLAWSFGVVAFLCLFFVGTYLELQADKSLASVYATQQ